MQLPELTREEQTALLESITHTFGNCTCREVNAERMYCDGHRFLAETQAFGTERTEITRIAILAYYRRMASLWTSAEFSRPFEIGQPADLITPQPVPGTAAQGDDSNVLPW